MNQLDEFVLSIKLPRLSSEYQPPLPSSAVVPRNKLEKLQKNEVPRIENRRVKWSRNGKFIAIAGNSIIYLLYPKTGDVLFQYNPQEVEADYRKTEMGIDPNEIKQNLIYSQNIVFAWHPTGSYLAMSCFGTTIHILDVKSSIKDFSYDVVRVSPHIDGPDMNQYITDIAWNPKGDKFATAASDFTICIYIMVKKQETDLNGSFQKQVILSGGHTGIINCLSWNPINDTIASASSDRSIRIWHIPTATEVDVLNGHTERVNSIDWNPEGTQIVSGSGFLRQDAVGLIDDRDGHVFIWDLSIPKNRFDQKYKGEIYSINHVIWTGNGHYIAMGEGPNVSLMYAEFKNADKHQRRWENPRYFIKKSFQIDGESFPVVTDFDLNHGETKIAVITRGITDSDYYILHIWDVETELEELEKSKKVVKPPAAKASAKAPAAKAPAPKAPAPKASAPKASAPKASQKPTKIPAPKIPHRASAATESKTKTAPKLKPAIKKTTSSYSREDTEVCQGCSVMGGKTAKSQTKHNQTVKKSLSIPNK